MRAVQRGVRPVVVDDGVQDQEHVGAHGAELAAHGHDDPELATGAAGGTYVAWGAEYDDPPDEYPEPDDADHCAASARALAASTCEITFCRWARSLR